MKKLRIVIGGYIGLLPSGGVTWDYIQYPLSFHSLGHDVYYIEDTMQYSRYQSPGQNWDDPSNSIQYLKETMEQFGLGDRWAYRDIATNRCYGLSIERVQEICNSADLFINISASTYLRDEYLRIPTRILIDSDPMFTQVQNWNDEEPEMSFSKIKDEFEVYTQLFTFGENIESNECRVPTYGLLWKTTRQPICLDLWKSSIEINPAGSFTSIMNWSTRKEMRYQNETWGQKDVEFQKFMNTPNAFSQGKFEMIVADSSKQMKSMELEQAGWRLLDPLQRIKNTDDYKDFIQFSLAEFSVAKETYVKSNSGWFSCRSACYLAAGRPVITQDTSWTKYIESGKGLFAFNDMETALEALREVSENAVLHSHIAKEIAIQFFDGRKVLNDLLNKL